MRPRPYRESFTYSAVWHNQTLQEIGLVGLFVRHLGPRQVSLAQVCSFLNCPYEIGPVSSPPWACMSSISQRCTEVNMTRAGLDISYEPGYTLLCPSATPVLTEFHDEQDEHDAAE